MSECSEPDAVTAELTQRLQQIRQRILLACQGSGRDPADIHLLAVSKTQSAEQVAMLARLGVDQFGENYWQEAQAKQQALNQQDHQQSANHDARRPLAIAWHFIGALQSNKAKVIAQHFAWVHSVGSSAIADKLSGARDPQATPLQLCVQVNLDQEVSKQGITPEQLDATLQRIITLPHIRLRGLMLLPAQAQDAQQRLARFTELADLLAQARARYANDQHPLDTLSMGMSEDLELAVTAGSHWLRIGSALFGPRVSSNQHQ